MRRTPAVVLLTGATGFVGKVVLAELLRRRDALGIERVLALVRARDPEQADARLRSEVLGSPCFAAEAPGYEKWVEALAGEITRPGLGLSAEARERVCADVSHVIHCAASVEFSLPIAEATAANVTGALHAVELARACRRLAGAAVVSTAYVTPHAAPRGRQVHGAEERLSPLPFDAEALLPRLARGDVDAGRLLADTGHPNTYTLTKCVAEHLLARRAGELPLTLVRPSIVSASRVHPRPGWIDSFAAFAGFVALIGAGRLRAVAGDPEARLDVVPCDAVAERIVDAAFAPGGALGIRHAVAGLAGACSIALCRERILGYFGPRGGAPPARLAYVGRRGPAFHLAHALHHELPGAAAALWLRLRRNRRLASAARRLRERQRSVNRDFAYFTHATFDFAAAHPLAPPLDPARYLDLVCEGVDRHLLRRRA
jgi:nucleoside-diphosphate-sugar epimerase